VYSHTWLVGEDFIVKLINGRPIIGGDDSRDRQGLVTRVSIVDA